MNAVDMLKYGQQTVLQTLQSLPEASWETPSACGVWSVKDIIAHLASYELVLIDVLSTFARSESDVSIPYLSRYTEPGGQLNDEEVTVRKQKSMKEVLGELNDAHARVLSMILRISPETLRQTGTFALDLERER